MAGAQQVAAGARLLAGDPLAGAAPRRDPAIERGRELQGHQGPARAHAQDEAGIDRIGLGAPEPDRDLDAGLAQLLDAAAVDPRIGIDRR